MKSSIDMTGLDPDGLANQIVSMYIQWHNGRKNWTDRVAEIIQYVYATSTRETTNSKNPWSHSTVVPKLTQIHDNLSTNYAEALFGNREFFDFEAASANDAVKSKRTAIVNYLTTKHDYNGFRSTMNRALQDWVDTGNCFVGVDYVRETIVDPKTNQVVVQYEGPKPYRISPYDIEFDHTVAEFKDSPKIIRELISRGELLRRVNQPMGKDYKPEAIEKMKKLCATVSGASDADVQKHIQMQMDGFSSPTFYFSSGKVELLHLIGDIYDMSTGELHEQCVISIIDRRYVLRNVKLQDYQGYARIYHSGWRKRPDNLWAQGPLDNLVGMQYLINHLENARADGFDQMLSPDRVHIGSVEIEKDGPVTNYFVDDAAGDVKNLVPDSSVLNADLQIERKEAQMEAYAGAPREAMGIRTPGEKTAFEVSTLTNAAYRLFQTKIEDFETEIVEPVLNGELEVAVIYLNGTDVAKVLDTDLGVAQFLNITKDDLTAKGKLKARGASHFAKRAQLVQELQGLNNILANDQNMAIHFPAQKRAELWNSALGFDRYELYVPFGQIEEEVEKAEYTQAAQQHIQEMQAAGVTDADAQARNAAGTVPAEQPVATPTGADAAGAALGSSNN